MPGQPTYFFAVFLAFLTIFGLREVTLLPAEARRLVVAVRGATRFAATERPTFLVTAPLRDLTLRRACGAARPALLTQVLPALRAATCPANSPRFAAALLIMPAFSCALMLFSAIAHAPRQIPAQQIITTAARPARARRRPRRCRLPARRALGSAQASTPAAGCRRHQ